MNTFTEKLSILLHSYKANEGFKRPHELTLCDGSQHSLTALIELSMIPGSTLEKIFVLYACGVDDHQAQVFDPRQVLSMTLYRDWYGPDKLTSRDNGMAGGKFCCVAGRQKPEVLAELATAIDTIQPFSEHHNPEAFTCFRASLERNGVSKQILTSKTDEALNILACANMSQFLFAIIHPFWDRNGRTSEELLHLICLSNGVKPLVFFNDIAKRYNERSALRMSTLDGVALELLPEIAQKMGQLSREEAYATVFDVYKQQSADLGMLHEYERWLLLQRKTPLGFIRSKAVIFGCAGIMGAYHDSVHQIIVEKIAYLDPSNLTRLLVDPITIRLVANQLCHATEINYDQLVATSA